MKSTQLATASKALDSLTKNNQSKRSLMIQQINNLKGELGQALVNQAIGFESADVLAMKEKLRQAEEQLTDLDLMDIGLPIVREEIGHFGFELKSLRHDYRAQKEHYLKQRTQNPEKAKTMLPQLRELAAKAECEHDLTNVIASAIKKQSENRDRLEFEEMLKRLANSPKRLSDKVFMEKIEAYADRFNGRQKLKERIASVNFVNPMRKVSAG